MALNGQDENGMAPRGAQAGRALDTTFRAGVRSTSRLIDQDGVLRLGPRHVVTGRVERGIVKVARKSIVGVKPTVKTTATVWRCPQAAGRRSRGRDVGILLRGTKRDDVERGRYWPAGLDQAAHEFTAECTCWAGTRWSSHAGSSRATVRSSTSHGRT